MIVKANRRQRLLDLEARKPVLTHRERIYLTLDAMTEEELSEELKRAKSDSHYKFIPNMSINADMEKLAISRAIEQMTAEELESELRRYEKIREATGSTDDSWFQLKIALLEIILC